MESLVEEWRPVLGYEGLYEVSSLGNVRSLSRKTASKHGLKTSPGRPIKRQISKNGYIRYGLCKGGVKKTHFAHRLVALAFIPPIIGKVQVNHKDSDRQNNVVSNLEWCTPLENLQHAVKNGAVFYRGFKSLETMQKAYNNLTHKHKTPPQAIKEWQ